MIKLQSLQRTVVASIGAVLLSATFVGAAVAPAQAGPVQPQSCLLVSHA
jgi:hypothetical protein